MKKMFIAVVIALGFISSAIADDNDEILAKLNEIERTVDFVYCHVVCNWMLTPEMTQGLNKDDMLTSCMGSCFRTMLNKPPPPGWE